jgi:hypothetical protein
LGNAGGSIARKATNAMTTQNLRKMCRPMNSHRCQPAIVASTTSAVASVE